jgi:hypothetical protein
VFIVSLEASLQMECVAKYILILIPYVQEATFRTLRTFVAHAQLHDRSPAWI